MNDARHPSPVRRMLGAASLRKFAPHLLIGIVLALVVIWLGGEVEQHITDIEAWIAGLGAWALPVYVGVFVLCTTVLIPDSLLCIIAGALFSLGWGSAVVAVASLCATTLQYALSRWLLRARIERLLEARPALASIERAVQRDQLRLQVLLRLTPLNPATISYLVGAAEVRYGSFFVACFAMMPGLFVEVYFGYASKHVVDLVTSGRKTVLLQDLTLVGGIVACFVVMGLIARLAHRAVVQAVAKSEPSSPGGDTA
jgi:uncharacterized membrane protein YdjX (TVP38/TMEM64 family)